MKRKLVILDRMIWLEGKLLISELVNLVKVEAGR